MGWGDIFLFALRALEYVAEQKGDIRSSVSPSSMSRAASSSTGQIPKWSPGDIVAGTVEFVRADFAKIDVRGTKICIFKSQAANRRIDDMGEVLEIGQKVEAVLLNSSDKKPGEWVASLAALDEARRRLAVGKLIRGNVLKGAVHEIMEGVVIVMADGVEIYVPHDDLSWEWVDHPGGTFKLGQVVNVRVEEIIAPNNWLTNPGRLRCKVRGSVKACLPAPVSPMLRMPFRAIPFTLKASVNKPRSCDEVVLHVLECLAAGLNQAHIGALTGLPDSALRAIGSLLAEEGLVNLEGLTRKGKHLVRSIAQARALKTQSVKGLFLSAAHPQSCVIMDESAADVAEDSINTPSPPFMKAREDELSKRPQLVELAITNAGADEKVAALRQIVAEGELHLYLQRDAGRWRTVWVDTPLSWMLASLWGSFEPVGVRPYRPASVDGPSCKRLLMVRSKVLSDNTPGPSPNDGMQLFTEPFSQTIWRRPDNSKAIFTDHKSAPPAEGALQFPMAASTFAKFGVSWRHQWCMVRFP